MKRTLIELLSDSSESDLTDDEEVPGCSKQNKKMHSNINLEDFSSALRWASIYDTEGVFEPLEEEKKSSKVKTKQKQKKKEKKRNQKDNKQMATGFFISFFFQKFVFKYIKLGTSFHYR